MGYTGSYVCSIWCGNDDYNPTNRMTGGSLPAQTWHDIMVAAHQGVEVLAADLLFALAQALDVAGDAARGLELRGHRRHVGPHPGLVVGGAAAAFSSASCRFSQILNG